MAAQAEPDGALRRVLGFEYGALLDEERAVPQRGAGLARSRALVHATFRNIPEYITSMNPCNQEETDDSMLSCF